MSNLEALRETFFEECDERLSELEAELSRILENGPDAEGFNAIFRTAHSIKAGAAAFKFKELVEFAHEFEAVLDLLRSNTLHADQDILKVMIAASDILATLVDAARDGIEVDEAAVADTKGHLRTLLHASGKTNNTSAPTSAKSKSDSGLFTTQENIFSIHFKPKSELFRHANDPIFIIRELMTLGELSTSCNPGHLPDLETIDPYNSYWSWSFTLKTEKEKTHVDEVFEFVIDDCELEIQQSATQNKHEEIQHTAQSPSRSSSDVNAEDRKDPAEKNIKASQAGANAAQHKTKSIRVDLQRIDKLVNMVGEIVITQSMLSQMIQKESPDGNSDIMRGLEDLALHTRELQESVMAVRMQPVGSLFARMPRVVRDLSRRLNKDIQLVMSGEDTEIDKTVIEEVSDPINHLLRNAIDHGVEKPEIREKAGKDRQGTIKLSAEHRGGSILISIQDDGAGINHSAVLKRAIERGIVEQNAQLSPSEIENLLFAPGFSTAAEITDISGRGVGLDVVKRNIENLGGRVSVNSKQGVGTTFTLILPLTLAVLDGMIVNVGQEKYVIPLTTIVESFRPTSQDIHMLPDDRKVVSIRGKYFSLINLGHIFDVPNAISDPEKGLVILVETDSMGKIGLVVDDIEGQQQVVIKSLEENYDPVPGISAATILGDGKVALILDIDNLRKSSRHVNDRAHEHQQVRQIISPQPVHSAAAEMHTTELST